MKHKIKSRYFGCSLLLGLLLSALPLSTAAAQIPVKENIDQYEIAPDVYPTGTEEEYNEVTFHPILLPMELKNTGITIALPVPGKGRVHYSLAVDTDDSAAIIKTEVFEDSEGRVPVKNRYESDEVYNYSYNFDASEKGTYYVKLTVPDYNGDEDIPIRFSARMNIREQLGDIPMTGEGKEGWIYYGLSAFCFGLLLLIRIKDADKTHTDYM